MFAFENVNKMLLIVLYEIKLWSIATQREEAGRRKKNTESQDVQKDSPVQLSRRGSCLCGVELRRKNI